MELSLVIHEVQIQIPPSINLVVVCVHNDKKYETPKRRKVDPQSRIANFADQEVKI